MRHRSPWRSGTRRLWLTCQLRPSTPLSFRIVQSPETSEIKAATLMLEDVQIGRDGRQGGFSYTVKASRPESSSKVFVTTLNTFTLSVPPHSHSAHPAPDHSAKMVLVFDLYYILLALREDDDKALPAAVRLSFEPSHSPGAKRQPTFLTIGAIKINVSTLPVRKVAVLAARLSGV